MVSLRMVLGQEFADLTQRSGPQNSGTTSPAWEAL